MYVVGEPSRGWRELLENLSPSEAEIELLEDGSAAADGESEDDDGGDPAAPPCCFILFAGAREYAGSLAARRIPFLVVGGDGEEAADGVTPLVRKTGFRSWNWLPADASERRMRHELSRLLHDARLELMQRRYRMLEKMKKDVIACKHALANKLGCVLGFLEISLDEAEEESSVLRFLRKMQSNVDAMEEALRRLDAALLPCRSWDVPSDSAGGGKKREYQSKG